MSDPWPLSEIFLAKAPAEAGRRPLDRAALELRLTSLWERGSGTWPTIALSAPAFVRHLAAHWPAAEEAERFLATVHASDLYLAGACAQGERAALVEFDRSFMNQVPSLVFRIDRSPAFSDEIRQLLRERLLVATAGARPKIVEYAGTSTLRSWLRVVALRTAVSLRRKRDEQPKEDFDARVAKTMFAGQDVELEYIRTRYQSELKEALRAAFASLPPEQRRVVRWHFADGLTGEAIAALLQVNRRTVVRWLASARTAIFHETRRLLQARLRLPPDELDSLVEMVRTSFDLSLSTLLKSGDAIA